MFFTVTSSLIFIFLYKRRRFPDILNASTQANPNRPLFLTLVESSADVFWISRPDLSEMIYVSPAYEQIWGRSCESLLENPKSFLKSLHEDDHAILNDKAIAQYAREPWQSTYRIRRPNGDIRWIRDIGHPVYDSHGNILFLTGIASDITEIHEKTEQLQAALVESQAANIAKSHFLANMSHELRTPLNAILGFSELIGALETDQKKISEYSRHIHESGERLLALVTNILETTQLESENTKTSCDIFDVVQMTKDIMANYSEEAAKNKVTVHVCNGESLKVCMPAANLKRIIANLISNAIKYGCPGSSVWLSWESPGDRQLRFVVKDNGRGIALQDRHKLFQPFERLGQEQSAIPGAGLGLALTRRLVEAHGGFISHSPNPGGGSIFKITFPETVFQDVIPTQCRLA